MGIALALWLGSEVRVKVRVRFSLRVWVIVLFCRNMVPFLIFYAFHFYIPHSALYPFPPFPVSKFEWDVKPHTLTHSRVKIVHYRYRPVL